MSTSISSSTQLAGLLGQPDLTTSATQSLLARHPGLKTLDAQLSRDTARLSAIGRMALALDAFRSRANGLAGENLGTALNVTGKAVSAQLTGPATGTHTVEVQQLAQAQKLATRALAYEDTAIGSGAPALVRIETGSGKDASSVTVRIEQGNNTLEGIAKAMRDAGLDAKVLDDGKGYALSLNGKPGAANAMRITVEGDAALGALLSYGSGAAGGMVQQAAAQDARALVDGKAVTSSTNTLDKAIPGLSLSLDTLGKSEIKLARDPAAVAGNVKQLVEAFNVLGSSLDGLKTGDPAQDALLSRVRSELARVLDSADPKALADIGIARKDGKLVLDTKKLDAAIAADPGKVTDLIGKPDTGLAGGFAKAVTRQMSQGGILADQAAVVQAHVDKLSAQKVEVSAIIERQAALLAQQYALGGTGGSSLFGLTGNKPLSLFDFMA
ncbi:flagellar filament capping protein FliD [Massilia sp. IC2-476]|uniref:flagellar filament capping protein FliD n=1 Tax=Massilia sp. IC2-476 TaxID=2887199 RepID=UPI001D1242EC|nr:flagellar filament capping protein FliD [Massilia sp. IC2-476]MCC2973630.1 flagellar filament capping protein FliD [Massilia sp. IC2-476]